MFQDLVSTSEGEDNRNHLEPVVLVAWDQRARDRSRFVINKWMTYRLWPTHDRVANYKTGNIAS
jgi:hypothetical protein